MGFQCLCSSNQAVDSCKVVWWMGDMGDPVFRSEFRNLVSGFRPGSQACRMLQRERLLQGSVAGGVFEALCLSYYLVSNACLQTSCAAARLCGRWGSWGTACSGPAVRLVGSCQESGSCSACFLRSSCGLPQGCVALGGHGGPRLQVWLIPGPQACRLLQRGRLLQGPVAGGGALKILI